MITSHKAFKLGLTSMVAMPAFRDDPHGLFANGNGDATAKAAAIGKLFDAFMADCFGTPDPAGGSKSLGDSMVITVTGDTYKTPTDRNAWPDTTPKNSNLLYVYGAGYLKTGWFGNEQGDGWDPSTGNPNAGRTSAACVPDAVAAALYAVAKGDQRRVNDFVQFNLGEGVINPVQL
jgi:hypothetical protein